MSRELLLNQSAIWIFGRITEDIKFNSKAYANLPETEREGHEENTPPFVSQNKFLLNQLRSKGVNFARIYSFVYQGSFFDLPAPAIFLVHGKGIDPEYARTSPEFADVSRMPSDIGRLGLGTTIPGSFPRGIRVWSYDKADYTIRMEVETGMFEQVLLDAMLGDDSRRQRLQCQRLQRAWLQRPRFQRKRL